MSDSKTVEMSRYYFTKFSLDDLQSLLTVLRTKFDPSCGPVWGSLVDQAKTEIERRCWTVTSGRPPAEPVPISFSVTMSKADLANTIRMLIVLSLADAQQHWRELFGVMAAGLTTLIDN